MPYRMLDAVKITTTMSVLGRRIQERFPSSGLAQLSDELGAVAAASAAGVEHVDRPVVSLRIAATLLIVLIVFGLAAMVYQLSAPTDPITFTEFIQVLEAGINDVVLIGLGVFFLVTLERRFKRRRVLAVMHELRSIAHIIDMHQLTKDPAHALHPGGDTPSSPRRTLSAPDLARYLDYCSELLSLIGKIAALYVQRFDDSVTLASVNEIESLTTSLSEKIWQKLMILELNPRIARSSA